MNTVLPAIESASDGRLAMVLKPLGNTPPGLHCQCISVSLLSITVSVYWPLEGGHFAAYLIEISAQTFIQNRLTQWHHDAVATDTHKAPLANDLKLAKRHCKSISFQIYNLLSRKGSRKTRHVVIPQFLHVLPADRDSKFEIGHELVDC